MGSLWFAVLLLTLAPGTAPAQTPSASPNAEVASVAGAPPRTSQELWSRILTLLQTNGGFVKHEDVERIIGIPFTEFEKEGEKPLIGADFLYSTKIELPGLQQIRMTLFEDRKFSGLGLAWGHRLGELPDCVKLESATRDLDALGWKGGPRPMKPGPSGVSFFRKSASEAARAANKHLDWGDPGVDHLTLLLPNQYSGCLNGFVTKIWQP